MLKRLKRLSPFPVKMQTIDIGSADVRGLKMEYCIECGEQLKEIDGRISGWQTEDGLVCDTCLELYTDNNGELELPVKRELC